MSRILVQSLMALAILTGATAENCGPGEFSNGDGVCQPCSWCLDQGHRDSDEMARRHREDACRRFAADCAPLLTASPPPPPTKSLAPTPMPPTPKSLAPTSLQAPTPTPPSVTPGGRGLTTKGPLVAGADQLPFWVSMVAVVIAAVLVGASVPILVYFIKQRQRAKKKDCGAAELGPTEPHERQPLQQDLPGPTVVAAAASAGPAVPDPDTRATDAENLAGCAPELESRGRPHQDTPASGGIAAAAGGSMGSQSSIYQTSKEMRRATQTDARGRRGCDVVTEEAASTD